MTPQEASEELKEEFEIFKTCIHKEDWENPDEELRKIIEANSMAIEILGQQPCEDCISRAYIESIVEELENICINGDEQVLSKLADIKNAPSVTPQPKTGQWIDGNPICPCCGEDKFKDLDADIWADWQPKYCPNCGAKMAESEEK